MPDAEDRRKEMEILRAVGDIDEKYVDEARPGDTKEKENSRNEEEQTRRNSRIVLFRVLVAAAVLFAIVIPVSMVHRHTRTLESGTGASVETADAGTGEETQLAAAAPETASGEAASASEAAPDEAAAEETAPAVLYAENAAADETAEESAGTAMAAYTDCDSLADAEALAGFTFTVPDARTLASLSESEEDGLSSVTSMQAQALEGTSIRVLYLDSSGQTVLSMQKDRSSASVNGTATESSTREARTADSTADSAEQAGRSITLAGAESDSTADTDTAVSATFSEDGYTCTVATAGNPVSAALLEKIADLADAQ